jgi:hypothetical protein
MVFAIFITLLSLASLSLASNVSPLVIWSSLSSSSINPSSLPLAAPGEQNHFGALDPATLSLPSSLCSTGVIISISDESLITSDFRSPSRPHVLESLLETLDLYSIELQVSFFSVDGKRVDDYLVERVRGECPGAVDVDSSGVFDENGASIVSLKLKDDTAMRVKEIMMKAGDLPIHVLLAGSGDKVFL